MGDSCRSVSAAAASAARMPVSAVIVLVRWAASKAVARGPLLAESAYAACAVLIVLSSSIRAPVGSRTAGMRRAGRRPSVALTARQKDFDGPSRSSSSATCVFRLSSNAARLVVARVAPCSRAARRAASVAGSWLRLKRLASCRRWSAAARSSASHQGWRGRR